MSLTLSKADFKLRSLDRKNRYRMIAKNRYVSGTTYLWNGRGLPMLINENDITKFNDIKLEAFTKRFADTFENRYLHRQINEYKKIGLYNISIVPTLYLGYFIISLDDYIIPSSTGSDIRYADIWDRYCLTTYFGDVRFNNTILNEFNLMRLYDEKGELIYTVENLRTLKAIYIQSIDDAHIYVSMIGKHMLIPHR